MITLNDKQKIASEILDSNLQIIACAGSGKTQVIATRIINLLKKGVSPESIVAFTYTEKAAAELKYRVFELSKELLESKISLAEMYIGTIHSWCLNLLQTHVSGVQKYSVLDEIKLKLFVDRAYKKAGMHELGMRGFVDTGLFIKLMSIVRESELKEGEVLPSKIKQSKEKFETYLKVNHYFDFTMILTEFLAEMNKEEQLYKYITNKIKYLIVDEYQDVNFIQESIIKKVYNTTCNLCVVGDDDQTIYQWRGSNVNNIINFSNNYDEVKQIKLTENYRSTNGIVDLASTIINKLPFTLRLEKVMESKSHQKFEEDDLQCKEFKDIDSEVNFIINKIKDLRGIAFKDKLDSKERGLDYSDMSILIRSWNVAQNYADGLQKAGIPYIVTGVNKLFEQDEVIACLNIFKYINKDIDKKTLTNSWEKLSNKIDKNKLKIAIEKVNSSYRKQLDTIEWYEYLILQKVFKDFRESIEISEETFSTDTNELGLEKGEIVFYNMGMFSQIIQDFETIHFKDDPESKILRFLNFIKYTAENYYPEGWLNKSFGNPNAVTIMTIHQSKGLEYPVVFIPAMNRNYFPAKKVGGKNIWHFFDKEKVKEYERFNGSLEDERRLFYVAITRSKKFLFITRAPKPTGNNLYNKESLFYSELGDSQYIYESDDTFIDRKKTIVESKTNKQEILLNFSLLESFFNCPYQFKFYVLYGFNEPLDARMGYGKSIHDSLMEIHSRSLVQDTPPESELEEILSRHLSLPYSIEKTKQTLTKKALESMKRYYNDYKNDFDSIEYVEKDIELDFDNGIMVNGRVDLIKQKDFNDTEKTYIVDFKSKYDPEKHEISYKQLLIYSLGYENLTGNKPDFMHIYDFENGKTKPRKVTSEALDDITKSVKEAAIKIVNNDLNGRCGEKDCPCRFKDSTTDINS